MSTNRTLDLNQRIYGLVLVLALGFLGVLVHQQMWSLTGLSAIQLQLRLESGGIRTDFPLVPTESRTLPLERDPAGEPSEDSAPVPESSLKPTTKPAANRTFPLVS